MYKKRRRVGIENHYWFRPTYFAQSHSQQLMKSAAGSVLPQMHACFAVVYPGTPVHVTTFVTAIRHLVTSTVRDLVCAHPP